MRAGGEPTIQYLTKNMIGSGDNDDVRFSEEQVPFAVAQPIESKLAGNQLVYRAEPVSQPGRNSAPVQAVPVNSLQRQREGNRPCGHAGTLEVRRTVSPVQIALAILLLFIFFPFVFLPFLIPSLYDTEYVCKHCRRRYTRSYN